MTHAFSGLGLLVTAALVTSLVGSGCGGDDAGAPTPDAGAALPSPVLHYDFEDDWTQTGVVVDVSGHGHHGDCDAVVWDQCPALARGPDGSQAATFAGRTCYRDSDYVAIEDSAFAVDMSRGTIALWAYYDEEAYGGAQLIDTWAYDPGTWGLGRNWNATEHVRATRFMVAPEGVAKYGEHLLLFPDNYVFSWNHYAVTWDGATVTGYFNGEPFDTQAQPPYPLSANDYYIAIGAFTHYAPRNSSDSNCYDYVDFTYPEGFVYPNNGFLIGRIDEVRIYETALSAQHVRELASQGVAGSN